MSYAKHFEHLERRALLAAGQLDPSFNTTGVAITDVDPAVLDYEQPIAVLPQADGKVIVVADAIRMPDSNDQPHRAVLVRYNANGSLDPTFGGDGIVIGDVPGWDSFWPQQAVLLGDGSVLVHGRLNRSFSPERLDHGLITVRYSSTGIPELTAEPTEVIQTGYWRQYLQQPDGKVLVAGKDNNGTPDVFHDDFGFIERLNANNTPDESFGNDDGRFILPAAFEEGFGLSTFALREDGRLVASMFSTILQLTPAGAVDASFGGGDGLLDLPPSQWTYSSVEPAPGGGFYAIAWIHRNTLPLSIVKFTADGAVDPTFTNGILPGEARPRDMIVQPDGKILVSGDVFITRFNANGTRDLTFGDAGFFSASSAVTGMNLGPVQLALTPDGIYGAGHHTNRIVTLRLQNNANAGGGDDANNVIVEVNTRGMYIVGTAAHDVITLATEGDSVVVTANGMVQKFHVSQAHQVSIIGSGGDDYVDLRELSAIVPRDGVEFAVSIEGGDGNDVLVGSQGDDRITGGGGDDRINGWTGDDLISGNAQGDRIDGGAGNDTLLGNGGRDRVGGNVGDDSILGGDQPDVLSGHAGNDTLAGEGSHDRLDGGAGRDLLSGAGGNDVFFARDAEADTLVGGLLGDDRALVDTLDSTAGIEQLLA